MSENRLLDFVRTNKCVEEALMKETDSELLYHFSPIRRNILDWFFFEKTDRILELGAECGVITALLCEWADNVVAVEENSDYAEVNKYMNRDRNNLTVINASSKAFLDGEYAVNADLYDYITMIGSFDEDALETVGGCLKPGGKLFVAMDNKYAIKYWSGATDNDTDNAFDGLQGNLNEKRYSRNKLEEVLKKAGFSNNEFYYPIPDYRLPTEIYSEEYLPKQGVMKKNTPNYVGPRLLAFDEALVADSLSSDEMFEWFANSFLVVSRK